ncbi:threonine/serine dehydratase [Glycomyces algeriensis]|uniref:threonine ammonia-lyase n=1 Tax=Glycomyces algeriensis TaxID=256037 RepID=A0A9W6GAK0_9ACTN|nr:threonine/serine dehydratase [Glycomyces algeriensis]MDA1364467.1 threonine/serine dehydratase [Glycomyces algeriensis]MDR7350500.1 threonine dehydratase [Glycomyces algeriensis]GLI43208.1 serine/threonine dehydratase [Glycomyces algeriensis]
MTTRKDVLEAAERIAPYVRDTPLFAADPGEGGCELHFKAEFLQHTGSFKPRGSFNRLLTAREAGELDPRVGVVCASGGNAGLAASYAASALGVPATVFVPATAPAMKVAKLRTLGAEVHQVGEQYAEAFEAAQRHVAETGAAFVHAYDQPAVAAGAGTIALEILRDLPEVTHIVVAVGGGGLFAGIAAVAAEHGVHVIAVEPEKAPTLHEALRAGRPVDVGVSGIAADSLGAKRIGEIAFAGAQQSPITSVLVSDDAIIAARQALWDQRRVVVEHGAATALAGVLSGQSGIGSTDKVAVVLCGANTDPGDLAGGHR